MDIRFQELRKIVHERGVSPMGIISDSNKFNEVKE